MSTDSKLKDTNSTTDNSAHVTTLDSQAGYVTMINTYTVGPERADNLLSFLVKSTEDIVRHVPGFVSANFHINAEKNQIVNYAQWTDRAALIAARDNAPLVALMKEHLEYADTFTPMPYELRTCIAGTNKAKP